MNVLVFDLESDYAHFRKFYTTSSPLTFAFPPRTALQGIVGAILGYSKDEYIERLKDACISVSLNNPIKKMRVPLNFVNTKDAPPVTISKLKAYFLGLRKAKWHEPHTQIRLEIVKKPSYRVYFYSPTNQVMTALFQLLNTHKCVYVPYLGIANFISNFHFLGEYEASIIKGNNEAIEVLSPIKIKGLLQEEFLVLEEGKVYFRERMPIQLKKDRTPAAYGTYLFEPNGKSIKARVKEYVKIKGIGNFVWM